MKSSGPYKASLGTKLVEVGIPVELFQSLNDDAVKVLHSVSANLENSAVATGLERSVFIPILKKGNGEKPSNN